MASARGQPTAATPAPADSARHPGHVDREAQGWDMQQCSRLPWALYPRRSRESVLRIRYRSSKSGRPTGFRKMVPSAPLRREARAHWLSSPDSMASTSASWMAMRLRLCQARAHRPGQNNPVSPGNSIASLSCRFG